MKENISTDQPSTRPAQSKGEGPMIKSPPTSLYFLKGIPISIISETGAEGPSLYMRPVSKLY